MSRSLARTGRRAAAAAMTAAAVPLLAPGLAHACGYEVHAAPHRSHVRGHRSALVIGDSTGVFATPKLARRGLEADAKECRQFAEGIAIARARRAAGHLPHLVVLALGANGPVSATQIASALHAVGAGRVLGLVTPRNLASSTRAMRAAARRRPGRVLLIDWRRYSAGHYGWFAADGLHVDASGAAAFAAYIARRAAGTIAPPTNRMRRYTRRTGRDCGHIRRLGRTLDVRILRRRMRLSCRHARHIAAKPPLRGFARWRWYDWRPTRAGRWRDLYLRSHHKLIVATAAVHHD